MEPEVHRSGNTEDEQSRPAIHVVSELQIPPAEIQRRKANDKRSHRLEKWRLRLELFGVLLAAAAAGAAIYYASVARNQLDEMRETNRLTKQAQSGADKAIADAEKMRQIASDSLAAAQRANEIAGQSLDFARGQQRAWVIPTISGTYVFEAGKSTTVAIQKANSGRAPALNVFTKYNVKVFDTPPDKPPSLPKPTEEAYGGVIAPEDVTANLPVLMPDETAARNLNNARTLLVVWGILTYTDYLASKGESFFCRQYFAARRMFVMCPWARDYAK